MALFALLFGGVELFWRGRGHLPSVVDDPLTWSAQRARVYAPGALALLGGSRMLLNVDLPTLRQERPETLPIQLGVGGAFPVATLRDLAFDEAFRGDVLVSLVAEGLEPSRWDDQKAWVETYHREWRPERRVDRSLKTALEWRVAAINPRVALRSVGRSLVDEGSLPEPFYLITRPDRSRAADYARSGLDRRRAAHRRLIVNHYKSIEISPPDRWLRGAREVLGLAERLAARGSRVALVRFPTAGVHWREEQRHFPRALYWDRFAASTSLPTLHFRDAPALRAFQLPDGSHVDQGDAPAFTRALVRELEKLSFFAPPAGAGAGREAS